MRGAAGHSCTRVVQRRPERCRQRGGGPRRGRSGPLATWAALGGETSPSYRGGTRLVERQRVTAENAAADQAWLGRIRVFGYTPCSPTLRRAKPSGFVNLLKGNTEPSTSDPLGAAQVSGGV